MGRRFALVGVVIVAKDRLFLQNTVMVIFSTLQVAYMTNYKPSDNELLMKLDIFNEWTTILLVDVLLIFSDGNPFNMDLEADCCFLFLLFGNLTVHLFFMIKNTIVATKDDCKRKKREGKKICFCFAGNQQPNKVEGMMVQVKTLKQQKKEKSRISPGHPGRSTKLEVI